MHFYTNVYAFPKAFFFLPSKLAFFVNGTAPAHQILKKRKNGKERKQIFP